MANWTNNNVAHRRVWGAELFLERLTTAFKDSADIKVESLINYAPGGAETRDTLAGSHAIVLHKFFTNALGAKLEPKVKERDAINEMKIVLRGTDKTLNDLADVADEKYAFMGEA